MFGGTDFRVVHNHDIVPHWPKALSHKGYHHVEKEVWYTSATGFKVCDDSGEDMSCSNSVTGNSIEDHTAYLGHSTSCNNADAYHLAILEASISKDSLEFYDLFERIVLDCNVTGFVKTYAKSYAQELMNNEQLFEDQERIRSMRKC